MKKCFKIVFLSVLIICVFMLSSCMYFMDAISSPDRFPGTTWTAVHDGVEISFEVYEEPIVRFKELQMDFGDRFLDTFPLETKMLGVISTGSKSLDFFADYDYYWMNLVSEDLPLESEEGKDYRTILADYTLISMDIQYKGTKHFTATVHQSSIDEIPEGTVLEFYRSNAQ